MRELRMSSDEGLCPHGYRPGCCAECAARRGRSDGDCRTCGLCCIAPYEQDVLADCDEADLKRLGATWTKRNVSVENGDMGIATRWKTQRAGPFHDAKACCCVALRGSILHRVSCAVYARRPRSCRCAIQPGDRSCRQLRKRFEVLNDR